MWRVESVEEQAEKLRQKYGAASVNRGMALNPDDFLEIMAWRNESDPYYAKLWLDHTYGGQYQRTVVSDRVRLLVAIGQSIALYEMEQLESHIRSALAHEVVPREVRECYADLPVPFQRAEHH